MLQIIDIDGGTMLDGYQPNLLYYMLDTRRLGADSLEEVGGPAALLFELERVTERGGFEPKLDRLKEVFRIDSELGELFIIWMENVLGRGRDKVMLSDAQLDEVTEEVEMLRETVKRWEKELRAEGREEGLKEGRVEALSLERMEEVLERLVKSEDFPDEESVFAFEG